MTRAGTVILATLTSFAVTPPILSPDENAGVYWKSIFIFFAGTLSILLYDRTKKNTPTKATRFWLVGIFIGLIAGYEMLYFKFSASCYGNQRCVVSYAPGKDDTARKSIVYWFARDSKPFDRILETHSCSPLDVWNLSDLCWQYYSMLILYFLMILVLVLLLVFLSDLIKIQ